MSYRSGDFLTLIFLDFGDYDTESCCFCDSVYRFIKNINYDQLSFSSCTEISEKEVDELVKKGFIEKISREKGVGEIGDAVMSVFLSR